MTEFRRPDDYGVAGASWQREVRVVVPPEHQGVVNALRAAYPAERLALPPDLRDLVDRID